MVGAGGTVTLRARLDREALAVLGGTVTDGAQTSDLHRAGWDISPARATKGGGAEIDVSKAFHRPSDLGVVIGELAGPGGPLQHFRLEGLLLLDRLGGRFLARFARFGLRRHLGSRERRCYTG